MAAMTGCAAVVVDAKDERSKAFYQKYGFEPFPDRPLRLFILTATIQKARKSKDSISPDCEP
jgi:hypothetical protein